MNRCRRDALRAGSSVCAHGRLARAIASRHRLSGTTRERSHPGRRQQRPVTYRASLIHAITPDRAPKAKQPTPQEDYLPRHAHTPTDAVGPSRSPARSKAVELLQVAGESVVARAVMNVALGTMLAVIAQGRL